MNAPQHGIFVPPCYDPLPVVLSFDDFDRGLCGWIDLKPNHTQPDFHPYPGALDKSWWGPTMLSSATFGLAGTHGSMNGTYSLKLTTRPTGRTYVEPPAAGSLGHAIKRLTVHRPRGRIRLETWFSYTAEQDRPGLGEKDFRAFGVFFDMQDDKARYFVGARYLNAVDGRLVRRWQIARSRDGITPEEWGHGKPGEWAKPGIDPQWYGKRYPDGSTDGFTWIPNGAQDLCYNETDDKINWTYLALTFDAAKRKYVELRCGDRTYDLHGFQPTLSPPYANIRGLLNPSFWIEADTDRSVFLYLDSVVISMD